jgi:hypothetical protein
VVGEPRAVSPVEGCHAAIICGDIQG